MARMASTRLGFQWHDYVQADAECDRYWAFKKAERRSLNEATKKSPRAATQGGEEDKRKNLHRLLACLELVTLSRKMEAIMMKNVSNSTKAPDLDMASLNLSTAKGLLEALSDEFDIMEDSVVSYQSNRNEKNAAILAYGTDRSFYTWMALLKAIQEYVDSSLATIDEVNK